MCDPVTILAVTTIASTAFQAQAQRQQGEFQQGVAKYNVRVAENKAQDVRRAGTEEELAHRRRAEALLSKQRAQLGASGVELGSGSALQLQEDTLTLGEADALRIRSNVSSQVGALQTQASLTESQGEFALAAGRNQATGTLLSGAAKVAGSGVADKWFTPNSAAVSIQSQTGFTGGATGVLSGAEFAQF